LEDYGMVDKNMVFLFCVSKYPAIKEDYGWKEEKNYFSMNYGFYACYYDGVSDHTENWDLYNAIKHHYFIESHAWHNDIEERKKCAERNLKDRIFEWHFKLNDSIGLDAGDFARTPEMLREVL